MEFLQLLIMLKPLLESVDATTLVVAVLFFVAYRIYKNNQKAEIFVKVNKVLEEFVLVNGASKDYTTVEMFVDENLDKAVDFILKHIRIAISPEIVKPILRTYYNNSILKQKKDTAVALSVVALEFVSSKNITTEEVLEEVLEEFRNKVVKVLGQDFSDRVLLDVLKANIN